MFEEVGRRLQEIKVKPKPFTKDMLTNGDLVQTRDGGVYLYIENENFSKHSKSGFIGLNNQFHMGLNAFNKNLIHQEFFLRGAADIMKIYSNKYVGEGISFYNEVFNYKISNIKWTWERED